jgi:hypothetical protein
MSHDDLGTDPPDRLPADDYSAWRTAPDVLAAEPEDQARRSAPWAVVAGVAAVVLALVGGVTYAVGALSGGGTQPADALPSGAFAVVSFDLDPSMGQKVDGFRFLRKFPALREKVPLDGDVREVLFDAVAEQAGWSDVDYDADVAPWLGKRLAIAAYPPPAAGDEFPTPTAVVALQVTDQGKAQAGLQRLVSSFPSTDGGAPSIGWAFSGDYVLLAETSGAARDLARRAEDKTLAQDEPFASDLAAAGDGVAVAWVDMTGAGRSLGGSVMGLGGTGGLLGGVAGAGGRSTLVARFDGPDVFEVVGRASGAGSAADWAQHPVRGMAELPASSAAALGLADGDELVPRAIESMRKSLGKQGADLDEGIASVEGELGIKVPEDLAVLLGDNLVAALDGERTEQLEVGARVTTDVAAAQRVLNKLEAAARSHGGDVPVVHTEAGGDLIVASSDQQADLLSRSGTLGDVPAFSRALPDLADAEVAVWVDLATVFETFFGSDGGVDENLEPIDGMGLTMSGDTDTATYRFRLVAH